jgi:hypothetical protein
VLVVGALISALAWGQLCDTDTGGRSRSGHDRVAAGRGLVLHRQGAAPGYVLFSPLLSTTTYLIDRDGEVVHTWTGDRAPGASVYLLGNGNLLRCVRERDRPIFQAGGEGGRIQEVTWDGETVWDYVLANSRRVQHHDIEPLPNGNVLAVVWERKTRQEAIRAGRRPELVPPDGLMPDAVVEIQPLPPTGGLIVWEWHVWDHLVQDHDPDQQHFGVVADQPELIDINGDHRPRPLTAEVVERLRALGYVVGNPSPNELRSDLVHTNSVAYNPALDQIILSAYRFNEVWVIDHSTTTAEAAGHSGGRGGRGGDLLYRWGNPQAYGRGSPEDQQLFAHHDARWVPAGHPGAGNIVIFDNGAGRPGGDYSAVVEIRPPVRADGRYELQAGRRFGPGAPWWTYTATPRSALAADFISGAQRLANGNTLICSGPDGRFLEVTAGGEIVWEYRSPFAGAAPNPAGDPPYSVFRATHIPPDSPAFAGRRLPHDARTAPRVSE